MNEYARCARILIGVSNEARHLDDCFDTAEKPFVQQICYGAVRHFHFYQNVLNHLIDKPLGPKHQDIVWVLICGLYSIEHLNRPAHASVNSAVESVKTLRKTWAKGLINGVLRRYGREAGQIRETLTNTLPEAQFSHPQWLVSMINDAWTDHQIFAANNSHAPMTLRVNLRKTSVETYLLMLEENGIGAKPGELASSAIYLEQPRPVTNLPGFEDGLVSVQDEAPQMAPFLLGAQPGDQVLDACAAPGTKTCHIIESQPECDVTAIDWDRKRVPKIQENLERLNFEATVLATDLMSVDNKSGYDRILLDVPCSATGIIRRHPDIKLLRKKKDVAKLAATQLELLTKAFGLLKTGGELLYATCSILPQENDDVVAQFLKNTPDAGVVSLHERAAESDRSDQQLRHTSHGIQFLPTTTSHDGFYYSLITRTSAQ